MKRKFIYGFALLALAGAITLPTNLSKNSGNLSDISLANVVALAQREDVFTDGKCYSAIETHATDKVYYCSFSCSLLLSKSTPQSGADTCQ